LLATGTVFDDGFGNAETVTGVATQIGTGEGNDRIIGSG